MKKPWQIHPDLLADRLTVVANLLAATRSTAVDEHRPEAGDGPWSLNCRVYERSLYTVAKATEEHDWLHIVDWTGLHFVFSVGIVPVKFYHGDHEDTAEPRRLRRSFPEKKQLQAAFDFVPAPEMEPVLRLVVETDDDGRAENIFLVELDVNGEPHNPWDIPFNTAAPTIALDEFRKEGVELPSPKVGEEPTADHGDVAAEDDSDAEAK